MAKQTVLPCSHEAVEATKKTHITRCLRTIGSILCEYEGWGTLITKACYRFWRLHVESCRFQVVVFKCFHFEKRFQVVVFKLSFSSFSCKREVHPQRFLCVFIRNRVNGPKRPLFHPNQETLWYAFHNQTDSCCSVRNYMCVHYLKKLKRFLSKSKGCRVVKSTTGQQCKLTRNKHGMVTRLTC